MRLFLLILIVTTIEVILIAKVGALIGFFPTFLIIIATALLGSWLLRQQWHFVMGKLSTLQSEPSQALLEALVLVICGILLVTPGFLTDIIGFLGLIPTLREHFVSALRKNTGKVMRGSFQIDMRASPYGNNQQTKAKKNDNIIEGEYEHKDDCST